MTQLTSRLSLPYPELDNSESPAGPAEINALAEALDIAAVYSQGILSDRPVSTPSTPGIEGRFYYVVGDSTSANNGVLWLDYGTGWVQINAPGTVIDLLGNRPAASAVPSGTRFFASDQIAEYLSNGTGWIRLGDQPGETSICLFGTADPGHILLQGQAWPSTTGIYADLYAKLGGTNLPDFRKNVPVGFMTSDPDFGTLLGAGGEKKHTLTQGELPNVNLNVTVYDGSGAKDAGSFATGDNDGTGSTAHVPLGGSGLAHNNLQPYVVVNFQAKL